jgi:plastocyanin
MLGATAGVAMLAGGIALAVAPEEGEGEGGGERPVVALAAFNVAFEPTSLTVPADEAFTLRFNNRDADVQHNVDIFDNAEYSGTALFEGELVTGVRELDYAVDPLAPGGYFFRCVVHPTMVGEIEAVPGGGEGGGGGGPTVVAQDIAFDTSSIELVADVPSTITFDNRDAGVQHNIAIYSDSTLGDELFNGELVTGPATFEYAVPALEAGEYYFQCIVHPPMNGTVVVSEAGGAGGGTEEPTGPTGAEQPTGATGGQPPGGGTAEPSTVVAQSLAFDTSTISLPGQGATITFDNRDAGVQHNISIYTDSSLSTELFNGELITGPATIEYAIPPLEAGEYYFLCIVHPNMNGPVTVA